MSSIHFWTTPKGDLSNYSFIFRNTEPLGTKLKNVSCSRLGTMFYLEIKKGKEAMKASDLQQKIGGMDDCMKIIMKDTKGCGQLSSNDTFFGDIWFIRVNTAEESNSEGVDFCGPVKKSHKGFSWICWKN